MQKLNTAAQMRQMDQMAMHGKYAIPPVVLMENAGHAVASEGAVFLDGWAGKDVVIICGKGNNGGDGFVIARHILGAGARVYVYVLGQPEKYSEEARIHLQTLEQMADGESCLISFWKDEGDKALLRQRLEESQVVIDAMLGTGFHGDLRPPMSDIVRMINEVSASGSLLVIAVDVPTGVNADTGAVSGACDEENEPLFAHLTVTFGALKRGLVLYPGRTCAGQLALDAIGMPQALLTKPEEEAAYLLQRHDIAEVLTPRSPDSHKGTHGTIGIIAGSQHMAGAALMAAHGAVRAGAGKVFLCVPALAAPYCIGKQPEIMVRGVGQSGCFQEEDADAIIRESRNWTAAAIGPGLGTDPETGRFVKKILTHIACPVVVDADALNLLAKEKEYIAGIKTPLIFTPHLAEFSRLSGLSVPEIKEDIMRAAVAFVREWHVTLVLKGAPTLLVSARTENIYINTTGNAGMACGGMGDVLTGMIAALAAHQGIEDVCSAACAAVYLHGAAGDDCRTRIGSYGFTPMEVADAVPGVIRSLDEEMEMPVLQRPMITGGHDVP